MNVESKTRNAINIHVNCFSSNN